MTPEEAMREAVALAERARGHTSPNPVVGCVILRDGEPVGRGWHHGPGQPHAEREALAEAGERARGATLYCTLEPCCHWGRTPPCTDGIVAAGVARVVYAVDDPDPQVAGRSAALLRAAGVDVEQGLLAEVATRQLTAYLHHRTTGRPWVLAKWAMTLDGKLATSSGDSRWVSGPESRQRVQQMRARADAVLVGSGTVLADDPSLTCRLPGADVRQPLRVVVDSRGRLPASARLFTDGAAPTLVASLAPRDLPCEVLVLPAHEGHVDVSALLTELGRRGVVELLCEAGGGLTGALLRASLVAQVAAVIAPKLAGGTGPTPWDGAGVARMADALPLAEVQLETLGDDVWISGRVRSS